MRPKGLGLGATKIIKEALPKEAARDKDGNTLVLKKGALAKVIAGSHKGQYCEVTLLKNIDNYRTFLLKY